MKQFHEILFMKGKTLLGLLLVLGLCPIVSVQAQNPPAKEGVKVPATLTSPAVSVVKTDTKASAVKEELPVDDGSMHLTKEGIKKYTPATITTNSTVQNRVFRLGRNVWIISRRGTKTVIGTNQVSNETSKKLKPIGASNNDIGETGKLQRIDTQAEKEQSQVVPQDQKKETPPVIKSNSQNKPFIAVPIKRAVPTTQIPTNSNFMIASYSETTNGAVSVNP